MRIAVVGGGIAGLSAAWELAQSVGDQANVTVYEPGHLGGKLRTTEFLGRQVDEGPDALLTRVPEGLAMCSELGLGDQLEPTRANRALLYSGGKLQPLPEGLVLGAPARLVPVLKSRILSLGGIGRASLDFVLPRWRRGGSDISVFDLVASRLGPEVAERLVEPLLGSIHAGSTRKLSAAATAPQLLAAAQSHRSLIVGLRPAAKGRSSAPGTTPLFMAPRQGMQAMADGLVEHLQSAGTNFVPLKVTSVRCEQRSVLVEPDGERFDGAVLALPAPAAYLLLGDALEDQNPGLAAMEFVSVAVVTLAFDAVALADLARLPGGQAGSTEITSSTEISGILVAPGSGLLMTACSFGSNKWPHWAPPGTAVLRLSVGRATDQAWDGLGDEALVERLCGELETVLGQRSAALSAPRAWRVSRWPASMPQYAVGHLDRVATATAALAEHAPTVRLAGASYNGVGVPACIGSGQRAVRELLSVMGKLGLPAS